MSNIKRMTADTINDFAEKIEYSKNNFIPMLSFVKMPLHDFDRYKFYSDKGIYLIDYIESEYCLYHLYHLSEDDGTLRATLILPSEWDKRFEIIEKSIPNVKQWFLDKDKSEKFIIQSLEYGEIEYFPTLSHYLIPTIIRNGFEPKYRMYMKRDGNLSINQHNELKNGLLEINYSDDILDDVIAFYYKDESIRNYQYLTNCTYEEFQEMLRQDFTIRNAKFVKSDNGKIIAGIIPSKESGKIWIDNFTVHPQYGDDGIGEYILNEEIVQLSKTCSGEDIYIYLNRDCRDAVTACEKIGFVPFEFWTDMILTRWFLQKYQGGSVIGL